MPHSRLGELLTQPVGAGLPDVLRDGERPSHAITEKGNEFRGRWSDFEHLADSFGLRL